MVSLEKDILVVWEFWNGSEIIKHRDFSKFAPVIKGRLQYYSATELCQAIRNYKDILVSERHWFTYTWTLKDFLSRTNGLDCFLDREAALSRYRKKAPTEFESSSSEIDGAEFYRDLNKEQVDSPK